MEDRAQLLGRVRGAVRGTPYEVEEAAAGVRVHGVAVLGGGADGGRSTATAAVEVLLDGRKGRAVLTSGSEVDGRPLSPGPEPRRLGGGAGSVDAEELQERVAGAVEAAGWRVETRPAAGGVLGSPLAVAAMLLMLFSMPLGVTLALML
ncbi:hypothetical protein [Nocardiopsis composta]|uniref:Uncharacterized protein n=1 Tax=Nocardiopsis composta TaxID=157465 RepID=A0A7W8QPE7_9ACTN|nr:hypothetical protein [Nocardiopsis composta]MBB5434203.1 hypothetical protein [Nocardiopsis composta]